MEAEEAESLGLCMNMILHLAVLCCGRLCL